MKVGSTAYSYRKYLSSGEMTLEGFLDKAVEIGLDCVDLTSYYFPKTDDEYLNHIKKYAYLKGLDITGTAVGNAVGQCVASAYSGTPPGDLSRVYRLHHLRQRGLPPGAERRRRFCRIAQRGRASDPSSGTGEHSHSRRG